MAPEPSFDALGEDRVWTAESALRLIPATNGPRIEIFRGNAVVTPHAGADHQNIELELAYPLKRAAAIAGLHTYHELNLIVGDDLFIPDISVLRVPAAGQASANASDAVVLVEVVSANHRRKDIIDRPAVYAAAGIPWYMCVETRDREPGIVLYELIDGEYQPVVAAPAGTPFVMKEPFEFTIDAADLLDA